MLKEFKFIRSRQELKQGESLPEKALMLRKELEEFLEDFVSGRIPGKSYTLSDLKAFVRSLIENQREKDRFWRVDGYWSLLPVGKHIPSDARIDFVYIPTYIAVSILTLFLKRFPEEALTIDGYIDSLHSGLYFASTKGLRGFRYEEESGTIEYLKMFSKSGVIKYVFENAEKDERLKPLYEIIVGKLMNYQEHIKEKKPLVYGFNCRIEPNQLQGILNSLNLDSLIDNLDQ